MRRIIIASLTLLLIGCAGLTTNYYTQTTQSWRGANIKSLVARWGRPDDQRIAPNGNTLYIYKTTSYANSNAPAAPAFGVHVNSQGRAVITTTPNVNATANRGAMSITCLSAFEANKSGTILAIQVVGSHCYGGESFAKRMANPAKPVEIKQ